MDASWANAAGMINVAATNNANNGFMAASVRYEGMRAIDKSFPPEIKYQSVRTSPRPQARRVTITASGNGAGHLPQFNRPATLSGRGVFYCFGPERRVC